MTVPGDAQNAVGVSPLEQNQVEHGATEDSQNFDQLLDLRDANWESISQAERSQEKAKLLRYSGLGLALGGVTLQALGVIDPSLSVDEPIDPSLYVPAGMGIVSAAGVRQWWADRRIKGFRKQEKQYNEQINNHIEAAQEVEKRQ